MPNAIVMSSPAIIIGMFGPKYLTYFSLPINETQTVGVSTFNIDQVAYLVTVKISITTAAITFERKS